MTRPDEIQIIEYLLGFQKTYVSSAEISKRVGGRKRFAVEGNWAVPVLHRMEVDDLVESNPYHHYRLKQGPALMKRLSSAKDRREKRCHDVIKTYVLGMQPHDDEKPFAQLVREVVQKSFPDDASHPPPKRD